MFIMKHFYFLIISFGILNSVLSSLPCIPKDFDNGSIVCVCNSTYCDTLDHFEGVEPGKYFLLESSKDGLRFSTSEGEMLKNISDETIKFEIVINRNTRYQSIIGFGGAFTDAAGINIDSLSTPEFQKTIIQQYYGESGLEYNIGRIPMGGTDFSTHNYTYADIENNSTLSNFNLTFEDFTYKIPHVKEAIELNPDIKLFASVWSAPRWMKTNGELIGIGSLKLEYYQLWADYFIKFLDEYKKENVTFWGITTQNEPLHGIFFDNGFNCMGWTAEQQRDWIKGNLGPTLNSSIHKDIKLIIYDDQRLHLTEYTNIILADEETAKYVSGIGIHWYTDFFLPAEILTRTHNKFPDYFILGTEACAGAIPFVGTDVVLGSWDRAVNYASDIITDLNHFVSGWTDWNLALDLEGGPNWAKNFVDSPIIIDKDADLAYKQPMYYALGHFSKFLPENSVRIEHHIISNLEDVNGVEVSTFMRPDGLTTVVLLNRLQEVQNVRITDPDHGLVELHLKPNSLSTLVYFSELVVTTDTTTDSNTDTSTTDSTDTSTDSNGEQNSSGYPISVESFYLITAMVLTNLITYLLKQ